MTLTHAKIAGYTEVDLPFPQAMAADELIGHRQRFYLDPLNDVSGYLKSQKGGGTSITRSPTHSIMAERAPVGPAEFGLYTVHHTLTVNAKRYANRVALAQEGARMSYEEFNARANQVAHELCRAASVPVTMSASSRRIRCPMS